jgi:hypothetical protein
VCDTFEQLKPKLHPDAPDIIDIELLPHLDGRAEDMAIWYICEKRKNVRVLRRRLKVVHQTLLNAIKDKGFPQSALDTFHVNCTSLQDIERGGGRFYYFR